MDSTRRTGGREAERIFLDALEIPLDERDSYLDVACRDDARVRIEVEQLLAAHERADSILAELDATLAASLLRETASLEAPRVGPYSLVAEIGRGGMGVVYLADRTDGQFEQRVALKLIKRGMDTDAIIARFLNERQILARLEHPNVARLLDGGVTADGQPYFAMEYASGMPITEYAERHRLDIDARLVLFDEVCGAVQYAHQNLIIHRDLKPSNILVTDEGRVKLLDFGIARLLGSERTAEATRHGRTAMTPEYAAPEQLRGEPLTTAADAYALGVVLHELLTGVRPRRGAFEPSSPPGADASLTAEPMRPSALPGLPDRLRRRLRGDLDDIVLKALNSESDRRYATAEALRDELNRFRSGLPIHAHRGEFGYRMRKFVRRHRLTVVAAAVILLSIASGTTLAFNQARQKTLEARKAEEVKQFVLGLFEHASPETAQGRDVTVGEMLDRGAARVMHDLGGQPAIQAEMLAVLGDVYISLDDLTEAERLIEMAMQKRHALYGTNHPEVAENLYLLGKLRRHAGDYDEAERYLTEALDMRFALNHETHAETANVHALLAETLMLLGRFDEAERHSLEALRIREKLFGGRDPLVASSVAQLAKGAYRKGNYDESERLYREALSILRLDAAAHPVEELSMLDRLALVLQDLGRFDESERVAREVLDGTSALFGPDHSKVATALHNLARLLKNRGALASADSMYERALHVYRTSLGNEHLFVAITLHDLGSLRLAQGAYSEAEPLLRESLQTYRAELGDRHAYVAMNLATLGRVLTATGRTEEAETLLRRSVRTYDEALPEDHPAIGTALSDLGELLMGDGRHSEAEPLFRRLVDLWTSAFPDHDTRSIRARVHLGDCLLALGKLDESEAVLSSAARAASLALGPDHPQTTAVNASLDLLQATRGENVGSWAR